jgi:hypothetical protein
VSSDWIRRVVCRHERHTEPDELGSALCQDCGGLVTVTLTRAAFDQAVEAVRRQPHIRACVDAGDGWICAPGCPARR